MVATDDVLLRSARDGDSGAYFRLWMRHDRFVHRVARRATRTAHDREDVVASAREAFWRALRNGRGPVGPVRPYLAAAIRNLAERHYRNGERMTIVATDDLATGAGDAPPPHHADRIALAESMRAALETLHPRHREVLVLGEVVQLSATEMAEHFGISTNAVAQLRARARRALRTAWDAQTRAA